MSVEITILILYIVVVAFLTVLCIEDTTRLLKSLGFVSIAYAVISVFFDQSGFWLYSIVCGLYIAMLISDRKFIPWFMWICSLLLFSLDIYIVVNKIYPDIIYYFDEMAFVIFWICIALCLLGFAIATTIIRYKRIKTACSADKQSQDDVFISARESRIGFADAGNVLSATSFVFALLYMGYVFHRYYYGWEFTTMHTNIMTVLLVFVFVCGVTAVILLSLAREYGYKEGVFSTLLYIWSWIPTAILIIIGVVLFVILGVASGEGATSKLNKKVYKVRDEKGALRTLNYNGEGTEAVDDLGAVWITADGGKTFRKRDLYVYEDPNGKKAYMRDPYGSSVYDQPSHLVDKDGQEYASSGSFGVLEETRLANYDDGSPREIIETYRVSQSEACKAEISETDDE